MEKVFLPSSIKETKGPESWGHRLYLFIFLRNTAILLSKKIPLFTCLHVKVCER